MLVRRRASLLSSERLEIHAKARHGVQQCCWMIIREGKARSWNNVVDPPGRLGLLVSVAGGGNSQWEEGRHQDGLGT